MKPPRFEYCDPRTLAEAVSVLAAHEGEAKVLAGGQSLLPLLNMRLARPAILVDLAKIPDLDYVRERDGGLEVGAMTRQRTLEHAEPVRQRYPFVHAAIRLIAHPQNRNQGTVGGSLAHADPAAELPALALALDAELHAGGPDGERVIAARDFFVTYLTTALGSAEVLTRVRLPALPPRSGWAVVEVARRHGDFALAGVMATLTLDGRGRCSAARVVLFGVGATPLRASAAEQALIGARPTDAGCAEAARRVTQAIDEPLTDVHATAEYRRELAIVLARRALGTALARAAA
jgi:carbon-monoxide dehydrogenase medium subunit